MDEVRIPPAGDPFYAAGERTEAELLEALAEDEAKQVRPHTPESAKHSLAASLARSTATLRYLAAMGVEPPEEDEA